MDSQAETLVYVLQLTRDKLKSYSNLLRLKRILLRLFSLLSTQSQQQGRVVLEAYLVDQ
jgi:hypothetical protein